MESLDSIKTLNLDTPAVGECSATKSSSCDKNENKRNYRLKTPKGTKDIRERKMLIRERVFDVIKTCYKRHGANALDTPVFELNEILKEKYGDESKLIYELKDYNNESCSLRYDLTVPFARFLAQNNLRSFRRYQIGKVYRRDQPSFRRGRFREFYQCDFDIAGETGPMIAEVECLKIIDEILTELDIGDFKIKVNHRMLLDSILSVCGVPSASFHTVCSSIDKLDKCEWSSVKEELTSKKGISLEVADNLWEFLKLKGDLQLIDELLLNEKLMCNKNAKQVLEEMQLLYKYLNCFNITPKISFDLSLARGLDYYTGLIFEAVLSDCVDLNIVNSEEEGGDDEDDDDEDEETKDDKRDDSQLNLGSVVGGGRYDDLVTKFLAKKERIPCIGFSVGVERIFAFIQARDKLSNKMSPTKIYVASAQKNLVEERMKLCDELWRHNICVFFFS